MKTWFNDPCDSEFDPTVVVTSMTIPNSCSIFIYLLTESHFHLLVGRQKCGVLPTMSAAPNLLYKNGIEPID